MRHLKTYKLFESNDKNIDQEIIDDLNDIVLDIVDDHNIRLRCWLYGAPAVGIRGNHSWHIVDKFVSTDSLGFVMLPHGDKSLILTKKEVSDVVDTIERINDYIKGKDLFIYVYYHVRDRNSMSEKMQSKIDVDSIHELLNYSFDKDDGSNKNYLCEISVVVNNEE